LHQLLGATRLLEVECSFERPPGTSLFCKGIRGVGV
jgi:hypothetical protein